MEKDFKSNYLNFYFSPDLLSEEEAKEELLSSGINVSMIDKKFNAFKKKLDSKISINMGRIFKLKYEVNQKEDYCVKESIDQSDFAIACRNGEQFSGDQAQPSEEELKKLLDISKAKNDVFKN